MSWQDSCKAAGGTPVPDDGKGNGPSCRFISAPTRTNPNGVVTYKPADMGIFERLEYSTSTALTKLGEQRDMTLGKVVEKRDEALAVTGLDHGLTGVAGKLLGIPSWAVALILVGVAAAYVLPRSGGLRSWD